MSEQVNLGILSEPASKPNTDQERDITTKRRLARTILSIWVEKGRDGKVWNLLDFCKALLKRDPNVW